MPQNAGRWYDAGRRGGAGKARAQKNAASRKETAFRGAVDETRTRDLHLGKVALYQLSYYRRRGTWSG